MYKKFYKTPKQFDNIVMLSDGEFLTGLYFENSKDANKFLLECKQKDLTIFDETKHWLDEYFAGKIPDFTPKFNLQNPTDFRTNVSLIMQKIPYGQTISYNDIACQIAKQKNIKKMSAQAVGGAVGWNPICLIIPCHRVIGSNGNLIGYGGGLNNKIELLKLEKISKK